MSGIFGERWENALRSYGTPGNFADSTIIELIHGQEDEIPFRILTSSGFAMRRELMDRQRADTIARKGMPLRWENDGSDCFLCDNVGQAKDIGDNLLREWDYHTDFVLLPNRYPLFRDHALLISKNHDHSNTKIPEILSEDYLSAMVNTSIEYDVCVDRNHANAGMSIPNHEHTHILPSVVRETNGELIQRNPLTQCTLEQSPFGGNTYFLKESHFDTLAFVCEESFDDIIDVLMQMEKAGEVFTINGYKEKLYVTPHLEEHAFACASDPEYSRVPQPGKPTYSEYLETLSSYLPSKGTYDWSRFFN